MFLRMGECHQFSDMMLSYLCVRQIRGNDKKWEDQLVGGYF